MNSIFGLQLPKLTLFPSRKGWAETDVEAVKNAAANAKVDFMMVDGF